MLTVARPWQNTARILTHSRLVAKAILEYTYGVNTMYEVVDQIKALFDGAQTVVIIQADNPDADSLGSSLALEHMLGDQGKQVYLYCGVDIPGYLHYMSGWDRVSSELPRQFDMSIVVDV